MNMRRVLPQMLLPLSLLATGCVTDATTELTKAPIDATTDISGGVSAATSEFTEPTKEITSSTTPGAWFSDDGFIKAEHKVRAFTAYSFHSLKTDVAQGRGEYLTSLAALLGLPQEHHPAFFEHMQEQYPLLYAEHITPVESLNRVLVEAQRVRAQAETSGRL